MYDKILKGIYKYGKKYVKRKMIQETVEQGARAASENVDDFARDWLDIDLLNEGEDEYMNARNEAYKKGRPFPDRKPNPHPLYRHVGSWNDEDLQEVMKSKKYQYDKYTQKKVQQYFELKYPGKQKLDATGRPY